MKRILVLGIVAFAINGYAATQSQTPQSATSARMDKKTGLYLSLGEPAPTLIGINAAYSPTDFLKLTAGMGKVSVTTSISFSSDGSASTSESSVTTLGLGAIGTVPGWNITPTLGLHYSHVLYSGDGGLAVNGFNESGGHVYFSMGVDWQTKAGFNAVAGYQQSLRSGVGGGLYLGAGWFVDWLS